tara:strand:+ start:368 stop:715 length:348 start_codon:yes stop_codon:yes gene_type:complete
MKKIYNNIFFIILVGIMSYGCQSVSDGLSLKKKENSQQFLIEKKQPLVMPPDFEKLPEPGSLSVNEDKKDNSEDDTDIDLQKIIESSKSNKQNSSNTNILSSEIEKKINEKLNKN